MRSITYFLFTILFLIAVFPTTSTGGDPAVKLSTEEMTRLDVCRDAIRLFQQFPDSIWPGFDLSKQPFIAYIPEKWALLFNYPAEVDDFTAFPAGWPAMNTDVLYHQGQLGNLAGQLSFDFEIDTILAAAVPLTDEKAADIFAFVVHENFHQFQKFGSHPAFGEIPWQREEKYPIDNIENTSMAYLEMQLLMKSLVAMDAGDRAKCLDNMRQFTAVRNYRWHALDPFIRLYEQGQEINEGTAAYAEAKSLALLSEMYHNSDLAEIPDSLEQEMASFTLVGHMLEDFSSRIADGSISPEDMPRNRIYPVGAAEGLLSDYLGISWKEDAQKAGEGFSFLKLFQKKLGIGENEYQTLLDQARKNYDYNSIMTATKELIDSYHAGFKNELAKFESQNGIKVEITIRSSGLWRSRSSGAKKWLMDKGRLELRNHYNIYSLSADDLNMQLTQSALLEENNWDTGIRTVSFFIPKIDSLIINGARIKTTAEDTTGFQTIEMASSNFKLETSRPGTILRDNDSIKIDFTN